MRKLVERKLVPGEYRARIARVHVKEYRTKAIRVSDREDAMIIAAKLVRAGFDFECYSSGHDSVFRAHTREGHRYLQVLMQQR